MTSHAGVQENPFGRDSGGLKFSVAALPGAVLSAPYVASACYASGSRISRTIVTSVDESPVVQPHARVAILVWSVT